MSNSIHSDLNRDQFSVSRPCKARNAVFLIDFADTLPPHRTKSADLHKLRPVTYRYKNDPTGTLQYGLVAEEVARVYPELVSYGADGKVMTVHYLTLTAMLLNELQKQAIENQRQARQIHQLTERSAQESERIEQQAIQNQRLSTQVAQLKGMFEQAMAAQRGPVASRRPSTGKQAPAR